MVATVALGCGTRDASHSRGGSDAPGHAGGTRAAGSGAAPTPIPQRPLDAAALDRIAALALTGRSIAVKLRSSDEIVLTVTATPSLAAEIEVSRCLGCVPMEEGAWRSHADALRAVSLPAALRDDPTALLEIGSTQLDGATAITTYHELVRALDGRPVASHALSIYVNDGLRQIRVTIRDLTPAALAGDAATAALVPRGEMDGLARELMVAVLRAW